MGLRPDLRETLSGAAQGRAQTVVGRRQTAHLLTELLQFVAGRREAGAQVGAGAVSETGDLRSQGGRARPCLFRCLPIPLEVLNAVPERPEARRTGCGIAGCGRNTGCRRLHSADAGLGLGHRQPFDLTRRLFRRASETALVGDAPRQIVAGRPQGRVEPVESGGLLRYPRCRVGVRLTDTLNARRLFIGRRPCRRKVLPVDTGAGRDLLNAAAQGFETALLLRRRLESLPGGRAETLELAVEFLEPPTGLSVSLGRPLHGVGRAACRLRRSTHLTLQTGLFRRGLRQDRPLTLHGLQTALLFGPERRDASAELREALGVGRVGLTGFPQFSAQQLHFAPAGCRLLRETVLSRRARRPALPEVAVQPADGGAGLRRLLLKFLLAGRELLDAAREAAQRLRRFVPRTDDQVYVATGHVTVRSGCGSAS